MENRLKGSIQVARVAAVVQAMSRASNAARPVRREFRAALGLGGAAVDA